MLVPGILKNNFFNNSVDRMFDDMFDMSNIWGNSRNLMSTDVKDLGDAYQLTVELPGFDKENIKADLNDGILTISAERKEEKQEKDENDNFIHRERYMGCLKRSFQVDRSINSEDIKAAFENGVLSVTYPKIKQEEIEENRTILIE